jgi:hypothetical protein
MSTKGAELVENIGSVGDRGKEPFEVVLVDTLREERDHLQKRSGVGAKFSEQGGGEREFDCGGEALVVPGLQHISFGVAPIP